MITRAYDQALNISVSKGAWTLKKCFSSYKNTHFFSVRLPKRLEDNSAHFLPWIWTFLHNTNSVQPKLRFGKIQKYRTESFCHFWPYFRLFHLQLMKEFINENNKFRLLVWSIYISSKQAPLQLILWEWMIIFG